MRRRFGLLTIIGVLILGLTGCGTAMYEVTDEEGDFIAHYCANIVAKYNRMQGDGIAFVVNKTTAEQNEYLGITYPEEEEEELPAVEEESGFSDTPDAPPEEEPADNFEVSSLSMGELLGYPELDIRCAGVHTQPEYQEGSYILLTPDDGFVYLVIEVGIANTGSDNIDCDFLGREPHFVLRLPDGSEYASAGSILLEDFYTFKENIPAGGVTRSIALMQIPAQYSDSYTEGALSLVVDGQAAPVDMTL